MKNEHGEILPYEGLLPFFANYVAIDANGMVWAFENKPRLIGGKWAAHGPKDCLDWPMRKKCPCQIEKAIWRVRVDCSNVESPTDFTQCLWERPKSIGILIGKDAGTSIDVIDNTLIG
jgi:hypothetical protein